MSQQEDVVEAGAGDPAEEEDQSLTPQVGISELLNRSTAEVLQ